MIHQLTSHQTVSATIDEVWHFFSTPGNLNLITPPSLHFRILSGNDVPIYNGQIIKYNIRIFPLFQVNWVTEIKNVVPLSAFTDEQLLGPYKFWLHRHQFVPTHRGVDIIDIVQYSIGFSFLGELIHYIWVKRQLTYIFRYRREKIKSIMYSKLD